MKTLLLLMIIAITCIYCNSSGTEPATTETPTPKADTLSAIVNQEVVDTLLSISDTVLQTQNYRLSFQKVDSIFIPALYDDQQAREEILSSHGNTFDASKDLEKYLSKSQGEYFQRAGERLQLTLRSGKTLSLIDHPQEGDEAEYFTYENYFPKTDAYLIRIQWYEGNGYLLVNRNNGSKKEVIGQVYPSPSGAELLSINEDMEAGFTTNGFEWLGKQKDSFVSRLTIIAGNWAPVSVKWLTDRDLILKIMRATDEDLTAYRSEYYRVTIE